MKKTNGRLFTAYVGLLLLLFIFPAVPFVAQQGECTVTVTQNINKRTGPGTEFDVAGVMTPGEALVVNGEARGRDGFIWYWLDDGTWLRSDLVVTSGDCTDLQNVGGANLDVVAVNTPGAVCVSVDREQLPLDLQPDAQLLILDRSGSMEERTASGDRRIDVARTVLLDYVDDLPEDTQIGLRAYGYGNDCQGTRLPYALSTLDRAELIETINDTAVADGTTPIAYSLSLIPGDFAGFRGDREVLLVTDGQEACNGDPVAVAQQLAEEDPNLTIHVIGFDINDPQAQANLRGIPQVARGTYIEADSVSELLQALSVIIRVPFEVRDTNDAFVDEGLVNRSAVAVASADYMVSVPEINIFDKQVSVENGRGTRLVVDADGNSEVVNNDALCIAEFCPDVPLPRLVIGEQGRVNRDDPGQSQVRRVRVRTEPGLDGAEVGRLEILEEFTVLDGPICNDGFLWWYVQNDRIEGWSAEGVFGNYFLEPLGIRN